MTNPNAVVSKYHGREPALLHRNEEKPRLNPDMTKPEQVLSMLKPFPADEMESWRISNEARNPKNDSSKVIEPVKSVRYSRLLDIPYHQTALSPEN